MTYIVKPPNGPSERFLSREECRELAKRVQSFAIGGGKTGLYIESSWKGNCRWARNQIISGGDIRNNSLDISRTIHGANNSTSTNQISDQRLEAAVRRAERLLQLKVESPEAEFYEEFNEPFNEPKLWFDRTYQMQSEQRAEIMRNLVKPAAAAGMLAAGYIEVAASGRAAIREGLRELYFPYTKAQYVVTVRDPGGQASGWAGVDWNDWGRIDTEKLSSIALEKCLRSRNPVAIEPGRYTTVLEPQAVCGLLDPLIDNLDRRSAELNRNAPFNLSANYSKIGIQVVDPRLTIGADPMDPDLGFPPFDLRGSVYKAVNWIENGILKQLAHSRNYAIENLGKNSGIPNPRAIRMSGGTASVESMIANTKRGILVTRFSDITTVDGRSLLLSGFTRDGLWLIENGKISKAIKNFRFTESTFVALNNILELGVPERVFHPNAPAVVPALRVQDFSFTAMTDAI